MERLETDQLEPVSTDTADLVSALSRLLCSPNGNEMVIDKDLSGGPGGFGSTNGPGSGQYVSPFSERMEAIQDSVRILPHHVLGIS